MDALHAELVEAKVNMKTIYSNPYGQATSSYGTGRSEGQNSYPAPLSNHGVVGLKFGSRKAAEGQVFCISKVIAHQKNCSIPVKFVRYHIKTLHAALQTHTAC